MQNIVGFLKSQQNILKAVLTIYNVFLAPIVNPLLAFYTTLWKVIIRLFGYVISILHLIARFFGRDSPNDYQSLDHNSPNDDQSLDQKSPNDYQSLDKKSPNDDLASDDLNSKTE